jgi:hypothetical protein
LQSVSSAGVTRTRRQTRGSFSVNCEPAEAYRFWRRLENLSQFMHYLESVEAKVMEMVLEKGECHEGRVLDGRREDERGECA